MEQERKNDIFITVRQKVTKLRTRDSEFTQKHKRLSILTLVAFGFSLMYIGGKISEAIQGK